MGSVLGEHSILMSEHVELPDDARELKHLVEVLRAKVDEQAHVIESFRAQDTHREARIEDKAAEARSVEAGIDVTPINEADQTLRRLVQRIAMILQS